VLRDMFQNHLLQLLTLTAMEPPVAFDATPAQREGQGAGASIAPTVGPTYRKEEGVAPQSETDLCRAQLFVDNWRWQGVPFYLRSGKLLKPRPPRS
jgi:glucose-6-phosphate 1-dehydrogenase